MTARLAPFADNCRDPFGAHAAEIASTRVKGRLRRPTACRRRWRPGRRMMIRMADHLSKAGRSRNMAAIRSKDTKPELALRAALRAAGVTGSSNLTGHLADCS